MKTETLAVIGPGRVGAALGRRLGQAGWPIIYGARNRTRDGLADIIADSGAGARLVSPSDAAAQARLILLAVPWAAARGSLESIGSLGGKVIIDTTNPLHYENGVEVEMEVAHSAAEMIQDWAPGAAVVKAFNTVNFRIMANPAVIDGPITVPIAGDDLAAKAIVETLVIDAGFHAFDAGPLANAHYIEKLAAFYVSLFFQDRADAFEYYLRPRPANSRMFGDGNNTL